MGQCAKLPVKFQGDLQRGLNFIFFVRVKFQKVLKILFLVWGLRIGWLANIVPSKLCVCQHYFAKVLISGLASCELGSVSYSTVDYISENTPIIGSHLLYADLGCRPTIWKRFFRYGVKSHKRMNIYKFTSYPMMGTCTHVCLNMQIYLREQQSYMPLSLFSSSLRLDMLWAGKLAINTGSIEKRIEWMFGCWYFPLMDWVRTFVKEIHTAIA